MSNSLSGPSNFADDGSAVIARQIEVHHSHLASEALDKINVCSDIYEIGRTVSLIKERGYKRVSTESHPTHQGGHCPSLSLSRALYHISELKTNCLTIPCYADRTAVP